MLENTFENNTIKNSQVNQTVNVFYGFDNMPLELVKQLKEKYPNEFKDDTADEIKKKIESAYQEASEIVNTADANFFISKKDKETLIRISETLKALEFYYNKKNTKEAKQYYHNLFVILVRIDLEQAINRYNTFPEEIKESDEMKYIYATFLFACENRFEEAGKIFEDLYYNRKCEIAFNYVVRYYFLQGKYKKVLGLLSSLEQKKYDEDGFLAAIFIMSKNKAKEFKETEIVKYNNNKFKDMPLFYLAVAEIVHSKYRKNKKIKERFKKALELTNSDNILVISMLCDVAERLGFRDEIVKYLLKINLTPYLKQRLVSLLVNKPTLTEEEIKKLQELKIELEESLSDIDYVNGKLYEEQGKELKAIRNFRDSYIKKGTLNSAYHYIQLSIKNYNKIDEDILRKLSLENDLTTTKMVVEGYKQIDDFENAIKSSYKALYLMGTKTKNEIIRQFWGTIMLSGGVFYKDVNIINRDAGVILQSVTSNKHKTVIIEDNVFYKENSKILGIELIRSTSQLGLELVNKKVEDKILCNNEQYIIKEIKDKYSLVSNMCMPIVEKDRGIKVFKSAKEDSNDLIKQIQEQLEEIQAEADRRMDIYMESKCIPLSSFFSNEKKVEDYEKIINTLLIDKNRVLYAGQPNDVDIKDGFVIDLTSIIVLALFDKLHVFAEELSGKVYITTSLKNKIKYHYEFLLKKQGTKELSIGVVKNEDGTSQMTRSEFDINKRIEFWTNIYRIIQTFTVEDVEATKEGILNIAKGDFLDKVQFDLMELARQKGIPYICDDLAIRSLADYTYNIKNTNCIILLENAYKDDYGQYLDSVMNLVKCQYIYIFYEEKLAMLFNYLYTNLEEDVINKVEDILNGLLGNKESFGLYVNILINVINNLKSIEYIKIFDKIQPNFKIQKVISIIIKSIHLACGKLNLEYKDYEKLICKESGGIEYKINFE